MKFEKIRVDLEPPSHAEKNHILKKIGKSRTSLTPKQRNRLDTADQFLVLMMELKSGRTSLGQFYMKKNPDIETIEDAEKIIKTNLTALGELMEEVPEVDAAINAILRVTGQSNIPIPGEDIGP